jgi:hypothetical protein
MASAHPSIDSRITPLSMRPHVTLLQFKSELKLLLPTAARGEETSCPR